MKIRAVELSGFRGFREVTRLEFPAGFVVLSGRNGAGKSTVLDAIDFALTGTIDKFAVKGAKGGGLDSHIWWLGGDAPARSYVTVEFEGADKRSVSVTRSKDGRVTPSLESVGEFLCARALPGDWARTLVKTTLIRDETIASLSMDLPEQARFEAVREAIGGLVGPDHSARITEIIAASKALKQEQDGRVQQARSELGRTLTALTEARSVAERQADVKEAEDAIRRLASELDIASSDIAERLRRRIADRKRSLQGLLDLIEEQELVAASIAHQRSPEGTKELADATQEQERAYASLEAALSLYEAAQAAMEAQRDADIYAADMVAILDHGEEIGLIDGHCPLCDAARSQPEFNAAIQRARDRLKDRGAAMKAAEDRVAIAKRELDEATTVKNDAEGRLIGLTVARDRTARRMDEIVTTFGQRGLGSIASPDAARSATLKQQEETAELEHALFVLEASEAHDRVTSLEARADELRQKLEAEENRAYAVDRGVELSRQMETSAKSVSNQVLQEQFDTVLPLLKELYQRLRPHTDWREIETDFGGKVRASLNFTVGEGKNPQFLFSSGQRRAAGLAFLLAIHLSRPWTTLKSLLLDDPVQHIDDYRALNLVEVLSAIRRADRQVIVAVEDAALADLLCRRLRSVPGQGGRRFDLTMDNKGSASIESQTDLMPMPRQVVDIATAS